MLQIRIVKYLNYQITDLVSGPELISVADYSHKRKGLLTNIIQLTGAYLEFVFRNDSLIYDMIHVTRVDRFSKRGLFDLDLGAFHWGFSRSETEAFFLRHVLTVEKLQNEYFMENEERILVGKREISFIDGKLSTISGVRS